MPNEVFLSADHFPLVRDIGVNRTESLYTHPNRVADFDVFLFVVHGCMQVIEEGTEYFVKENEHLFLKKGIHHWGLPATLPGTTWYWIHFDLPLDEQMNYREHAPLPEIEYYQRDHYQYLIPMPKYGSSAFHSDLEPRLRALTADYFKPAEHRMVHVSLRVCQLFLELQKEVAQQGNGPLKSKTDTISSRVMSFLLEHAEGDFDSLSISAHMNLNYSYLSSMFKEQTGQTIVEAHARLRMGKAIEWMRNSTLNVSEISEKLGYRNPYYFSRVFKKILGQSPSSYMQQLYKS
ncbi:AraC family transcriptional regulator [Paenibacillus sp. FSL H8-0548]|uniref:helix-turn-helix domain-containing protein n=1 Tax=Paenibacillus sp. FSL H8-0548 TaxID=1920422 RepID=UPI0009701881|nr:AraC family transcriptional regulator [Paenibacillus sp. FSL H8-0548]OMF26248.1 AraC family transcriptional regulator [Paenibacillus sp. FSL H8-0548]